jgi:hypothetical protein
MCRKFSVAVLLSILAACSSNPENQEVVKGLFSGGKAAEPTAEFLTLAEREVPAYVVSVEARVGAFSTLLRQTVNGKGEETWISGDGLSVGMRQGMVIATRGFGGDMLAGDARETHALLKAGREGISKRFITILNGEDEAQTLSFVCRVSPQTRQPLELGGYTADTLLVKEECRNETISYNNLFWVEQGTAKIVQSRQWISSHLGTLALRSAPR